MPISRDDFERGQTEDFNEQRVIQFLIEHSGEAFTVQEIDRAMGKGSGRNAGGQTERGSRELRLQLLLETLAGQGKIASRLVNTDRGHKRFYLAVA